MYLPRLRRLNDVLKEIKKVDPRTCLTYYMLREMLKDGQLTNFHYGNSYVVNLDELYTYLKKPVKKRGRPKKEGKK